MERESNNDVFPDRPPDPEKQIQRIGDSGLESASQLAQIPADTAPHASEQPDSSRGNGAERSKVSKSPRKKSSGRKDRGRRHVVRGSVLSRSLIQTLERLGENVRALKKMESELRATLKPQGALGRLFFDRFWASILRLILVARLEESGLAPQGIAAKNSASVPSLREGALPILVLPGDGDGSREDPEETIVFDSDVFRRLALIARYDRSAGKPAWLL